MLIRFLHYLQLINSTVFAVQSSLVNSLVLASWMACVAENSLQTWLANWTFFVVSWYLLAAFVSQLKLQNWGFLGLMEKRRGGKRGKKSDKRLSRAFIWPYDLRVPCHNQACVWSGFQTLEDCGTFGVPVLPFVFNTKEAIWSTRLCILSLHWPPTGPGHNTLWPLCSSNVSKKHAKLASDMNLEPDLNNSWHAPTNLFSPCFLADAKYEQTALGMH